MNENNLKLLIAMFQNEMGAEEAINALKTTSKEEFGIQAMVAIKKDLTSGIHYTDVGMNPAKGALAGVILGSALGILAGGGTLVLGALWAIIGGLIGERKRTGEFSSVRMNELVGSLVPGSSALVAVVEKERLQALENQFNQFEAEIFTAEITEDLSEKLSPYRHKGFTEFTKHLNS